MKDLINKLLIFSLCSYIIWFGGRELISTLAFASALVTTYLCSYSKKSRITIFLIILYCCVSVSAFEFAVYLPLLFYDVFLLSDFIHALYSDNSYKDKYQTLICLGTLCATAVFLLTRLPQSFILPWLLIPGISVALALHSTRIDYLFSQLHQIRDENMESNMYLKEKNRALLEQQNYEIHLATLSERNRIAREIHDNVGHLLTRSILQTGALKVINKDSVLDEPLATLHETLNTAMTSIRSSVHDLHDESIDLQIVLSDIIKDIQAPSVTLEYDAGGSIPKEIKYSFISIVKEALNNVQKHSNADKVSIVIREHPGFYFLKIKDNGTSQSNFSEQSGIGLSNMKERVRSLGGTIRFHTEDGFCVNISIIKNKYNDT